MRNAKRVLALLLALVLVVGNVPLVYADTVPAQTTAATEPAVTEPTVTAPATDDADHIPAETTGETAPAETIPAETTAETFPAETTGETAPAETTAETVPAETTIVLNQVRNSVAGAAASAPRTVDFMEYLEDPLLVLFQSEETIDLRQWLVDAYGVPGDIPFTCEPAAVAYGTYAEGDTFPLTVTAGEGHEGSCTVQAEVRYATPYVTTRVLTTKLRIYEGATVIKETTINPSNSFNDVGYDYARAWNVTLQADKDYRLEIAWGAPVFDGYTATKAQVVEMYSAGQFSDPVGGFLKNLSVTNQYGMNQLSQEGSAGCTVRSSGYGAYTMHLALDRGDGDTTNKFKVNFIFEASGKEADTTSTVPQGSNISLVARTQYSADHYYFSWAKNGTAIAGANGRTYTEAEAKPGDVYVVTIRRRNNGVGCTGSESWTHTITVTDETFSGPKPIEGIVYDGTVQKLFADGVAPAGYDVYYDMKAGDPMFRLGYAYEYFWNESSPYVPEYCSANAGTYTIRYFIASHGWYNMTDPINGTAFQLLEEGSITCTIAQASPTLDAAPTPVTGLTVDGQPHALVNAGSATNGTVQYRLPGGAWSNDIPTAADAGTYTVEYRIAGKDRNYKTLESSAYKVEVTISAIDISDAQVTLEYDSVNYDTTAKTPAVVVMKNGKQLTQDTDYTVTYADNINVGTATVTITGVGSYTGEITRTFRITKIDAGDVICTGTDVTYDGTPKMPFTLKLGDKVLTLDQDYTVAHGDNVNAGEVTVTFSSDNWDGTFQATFNIHPIQLSGLRIENPDKTYNGSALAEGASIAFDGVIAQDQGSVQITADIAYADANAGTGKTVTASSLALTGGKANNYILPADTAEITAAGTISPMPITVTAYGNSKIYGEADPELIRMVYPRPFDPIQGISVSRAAGEDVGDYDITVTVDAAKNPNYDITPANGSFTILPKSLHSADITLSGVEERYVYTGSAIQPEITLMDGDAVLVEGTDYTVAYGDNVNVYDNNAVTVTGMGNYADELVRHFEITSILPDYTPPTGLTATYGQKLSEIDLSAFGNEYGQWQWDDPATQVQVENQGYPATFVPESGNYQNVPATLPVTVSPKTVSFDGCIVWDKEYDGTTAANVTDIVFDGKLPGDTLDHTYTAVFDDASVGEQKKVTLTITLKDPNYIMPENVIENFGRIYARAVMPDIALSRTSFVYNGKPQMPALTLKDDLGNVIPESEYSVSYSGNVNVGTAIATITDNAGGNYKLAECAATYTITPAPLTITAENKSAYVGTSLPALTYKVTGLCGSDKLLKDPTLSTSADMGKLGTYAINITGADAGTNYVITYVPGDLAVVALPVEEEAPKKPASRQETPKPITVPISGEDNTIHVEAEVKAHEATIKDFDVDRLNHVVGGHVEEVGTVTVDFSELKQNIETVNIPTAAIAHIAEAAADEGNDTEKLEIILTKDISVEFDAIALTHKIEQAEDKTITITVQPENRAKDVTKEQKKAFDNRPAYQVLINSGDKHISEIDGEVTVSVAYQLKKGEIAEGLKVYAVDEDGSLTPCEAEYDPETGRIRWKTNKHSFYVIAYEQPTEEIAEEQVPEAPAPIVPSAPAAKSGSSWLLWLSAACLSAAALGACLLLMMNKPGKYRN